MGWQDRDDGQFNENLPEISLEELERQADMEALREALREDHRQRISLDDFLSGEEFEKPKDSRDETQQDLH